MIVFILAIGLCIGSFLNVCIYRIPKEESIAFPPSHCMSCGYKLKFYDNVPVLSYLFLGGKCRKCGEKIAIQYPIVELLHGIIYVTLFLKFGLTLEFFKFALLSSVLLVIGIIDLKTYYVYESTTKVGMIIGIAFFILEWIQNKTFPVDYLLGTIIGFFVIFIIVKVTGGMGEGDIEIMTICGLFLGTKQVLLTLFLSFIFGSLAGIYFLLAKKKGMKSEMAFGPYIVLAALVTVYFGVNIISLYTSIL